MWGFKPYDASGASAGLVAGENQKRRQSVASRTTHLLSVLRPETGSRPVRI
jgi:hypothetical protein